ncbi:TNF receptor-associated factor 2-like [Glandiceps talaboti]
MLMQSSVSSNTLAGLAGYPRTLLGGHDIDPKYVCSLCSNILRNPHQTVCGHRYCRACFSDTLTRENKLLCIPCKQEGVDGQTLTRDDIYPDRAILRELSSLHVECLNDDCRWKGLYKEYDKDHVKSCPFELITCTKDGCNVQLRRCDITYHMDTTCQMRTIKCQHCELNLAYKELEIHYARCSRYPVICHNCGKSNIPREKLQHHLDITDGDCTKKMTACKFSDLGCQEMVLSCFFIYIIYVELGKEKDHDDITISSHLMLLLKSIQTVQSTLQQYKNKPGEMENLSHVIEEHNQNLCNLRVRVGNTQSQIDQINKEVGSKGLSGEWPKYVEKQTKLFDALQKQVVSVQTKLTTYEGVVAVLNHQTEQNGGMVQNIQRDGERNKEKIQTLERKIKAQDRIIALKDVALAEQDLRIQSLEMASYDGVLVWKISDFSRKRQDAISGKTMSIYSPCFYTSRHGYKMCARIYLNGDGMGKGNHASLFFVIMRGPFDALLRWPFRQKVTLMWIDQNNREHVIDAFRPDPTSSSFKRPTHDMNVASGCPLFMPLSQIDSPRHAYVKDDVAFIRIIVDTIDIT